MPRKTKRAFLSIEADLKAAAKKRLRQNTDSATTNPDAEPAAHNTEPVSHTGNTEPVVHSGPLTAAQSTINRPSATPPTSRTTGTR